ncbi:hypothetical protein [Hafnia alvei]|nr:hypothetical protein [Hafnia alvei]
MLRTTLSRKCRLSLMPPAMIWWRPYPRAASYITAVLLQHAAWLASFFFKLFISQLNNLIVLGEAVHSKNELIEGVLRWIDDNIEKRLKTKDVAKKSGYSFQYYLIHSLLYTYQL